MESLEQAGQYLESLIHVDGRGGGHRDGRSGSGMDRDGLGAMRDLMAALDHPERCAPSLHIAGSKGKGSVALFAESILTALGERVGTFTSPHLSRWSERYRVAGEEAAGAAVARAVDAVRPWVDTARRERPRRAPSFFDAATAAAFVLFRAERVDRIVAEVGLGGRLDATNVLEPEVTCITHLELEHTDRLGDTLSQIAFEKGGIIKHRTPCVVGPLAAEAREVIARLAAEREAPLLELGRDFTAEIEVLADPLQGAHLVYRDTGGLVASVRLGAAGEHQARNAALAIACVARLGGHASGAVAAAAAAALPGCRLPGRVETVGRRPLALVDAAHTPDSAAALGRVLAGVSAEHVHLVVSVSAGKRLEQVLAPLVAALPAGSAVTVTRAEAHRSLAPAEVRRALVALDRRLDVRVVPNPHLALRAAREAAGKRDLLLATGSVYLAGIARDLWRETPPRPVAVSRRPSRAHAQGSRGPGGRG